MSNNLDNLVLLANEPAKEFAEKVANNLREKYEEAKRKEFQLYVVKTKKFHDGELDVQIPTNVRKRDVFHIHSFPDPTVNYVELFMVNDALRRASSNEIANVLPYMPYTRQDRKDRPRVPITAKLMAKLTEESGAKRILTVDLHAGQIQGFYEIPVDNLYASNLIVDRIQKDYPDEIKKGKIVAPDTGAIKISRDVAKKLGMGIVVLDKRRPEQGKAEIMNIIGDIDGYYAFLLDDLIDSGGTIISGGNALLEAGALGIYAIATHAVFSEKDGSTAESKLEKVAEEVIISDSKPIKHPSEKIKIISLASLISEAIYRIQIGGSISTLF